MKSSAIYITNNFIRFTQYKKIGSKEYQLDIASFKKEEVPLHLKAFLKKNKISTDNLTLYIYRNILGKISVILRFYLRGGQTLQVRALPAGG